MNSYGFRCFQCEQPLALAEHGFCSRCVSLLTRPAYCRQCGSGLLHSQPHCGNCLRDEPKWQRIMQVASYQAPLVGWIQRFKFERHFWLDSALARLLLLEIYAQRRESYFDWPEVILPVPLFWQRQWQRGYNQATLIARYLSAKLAIPLDTQSLQRIRATPAQSSLNASERRRNLYHAFRYTPLKPYQRVALVDDVVTTGSTLNAVCAELKRHKVKDVMVWALARA